MQASQHLTHALQAVLTTVLHRPGLPPCCFLFLCCLILLLSVSMFLALSSCPALQTKIRFCVLCPDYLCTALQSRPFRQTQNGFTQIACAYSFCHGGLVGKTLPAALRCTGPARRALLLSGLCILLCSSERQLYLGLAGASSDSTVIRGLIVPAGLRRDWPLLATAVQPHGSSPLSLHATKARLQTGYHTQALQQCNPRHTWPCRCSCGWHWGGPFCWGSLHTLSAEAAQTSRVPTARLYLTNGRAVQVCSNRWCRPVPPFKEGLHCTVKAGCDMHSCLAYGIDRTQPLRSQATVSYSWAFLVFSKTAQSRLCMMHTLSRSAGRPDINVSRLRGEPLSILGSARRRKASCTYSQGFSCPTTALGCCWIPATKKRAQ